MIIQHAFFHSLFIRLIISIGLVFAVRPALASQQTLLMVGDSISAAYGMSLEQGWVALLQKEISATHPDYKIVNASISGETTSGALFRLPALLEQHQPDLVVIELGGNDGLRGYPIASLRENLTTMARLSKDNGAKVIIVSMEIPPNYGARYTTGFRESFNEAAEATDSTLAPFLLDGIATQKSLMQSDGIHPNVSAQVKLLANFLPTLQKLLP
ncbi:MAG: acyl-CoA thioesterase-1 [Halioglobus sp.]